MSSAPETFHELYIDELKDLWSANDQMVRALKKIAPGASDATLVDMLDRSQTGIEKHTDLLKDLIEAHGETVKKEHCKGMEGLAAEAIKHAVDEAPARGPVRDAAIIAQYQRMTHYGIAGFGTVAAFATALGLTEDAQKLKDATGEIYKGDEFMNRLAETAVNPDAADD